MMMPPLNIDKEVFMWAGVGFCVLLCGVGIYAGGVSEGARAMKEEQEQARAKIVLELADTKVKLSQARADLVGAKAQAAADCAIDCEGVCAKEVKAALDANHDLVCGEFK